jgi:hypothetical protein
MNFANKPNDAVLSARAFDIDAQVALDQFRGERVGAEARCDVVAQSSEGEARFTRAFA